MFANSLRSFPHGTVEIYEYVFTLGPRAPLTVRSGMRINSRPERVNLRANPNPNRLISSLSGLDTSLAGLVSGLRGQMKGFGIYMCAHTDGWQLWPLPSK